MKRNQSAMALACIVAVLTLSGCASARSWWPFGETRADGAAAQQSSQSAAYQGGGQADTYRPMEVHEPR